MKTKPVLVYYYFILLASSGKLGWLTRGKKTEDGDDYIIFIKTNVVIKWVYNIIDFKQFEL